MGRRLLRQRVTQPLLQLDRLNQRLDQVEACVNDALLRADIREALKNLPDIERLTNRILGQKATPRDLENLGNALDAVPALQALIGDRLSVTGNRSSVNSERSAVNGDQSSVSDDLSEGPQSPISSLHSLFQQLDSCREVGDLIDRAIVDEAPANLNKPGVIKPGFSAELDGVVNSSEHARQWVDDLEPREQERTGIQSLKVGFNKVFGYYIEVTKSNTDLVPDDYVRKQTLTNAERYITPELKEYETLILNAEERMLQIEERLFKEVCRQLSQYAPRLLATAQVLAQIDVAAALAEVAATHDYTRPALTTESCLAVKQGRHPVVEQAMLRPGRRDEVGDRFVPNNAHMDQEERIQIITGPNMSGKSTYLRQVALIALMAQIGSFVPAQQATIGLVDRIFTRIGAHDELHAGRSTFMVEMVETAEILNHATHQSLLILDEIGRGTSTYDGLAIAWAVIEYLHNHPRLKPRTLFATHYHELVGLADLLPKVANYNVAVAEEGDRVIFLHQIVPGGADDSYGIHVAQLAGLPRDVVNRANEILKDLEAHAPTAAVEPSPYTPSQQMALFPETSPILDELEQLDVNAMSPLEAINKLYEWKRRYSDGKEA